MIRFMENFLIYDQVRESAYMDLQWISKYYDIRQSANQLALRVKGPNSRTVLYQTNAAGSRSVYLPLGHFLLTTNKITVSQKLVEFTPSNVACFGVSSIALGVDDYILAFGFSTAKTGFVRYVGADGKAQEDTFTMPTSLGATENTVEWSFVKDVNDAAQYRLFTIWVNNKPVYSAQSFCQVGAASTLAARIHGGVATVAVGTDRPTKTVNATGNVTIPAFGITDVAVTNGQRLGRIRVLSRSPTADVSPNTMTPSVVTGDHATLVGAVPPSLTQYLQSNVAGAQEMFGALPFAGLSSEAVLGVAVRVLGSKNDPEGFDATAVLRDGSREFNSDPIPLDLSPAFGMAVYEVNPYNGLPWTPLEANNLRFGVRIG